MVVLAFVVPGHATTPGVQVRVVLAKAQYQLGTEPIKLAVIVENVSGQTILASQSFEEESFPLLLTFIAPDGTPFVAEQEQVPLPEPPPPLDLPVGGTFVQVDPLVTFPPDFVESVTVDDARLLYPGLSVPPAVPGFYRVFATLPLRTYAAIFRSEAGVDYARLDTALFGGTIVSKEVTFALVADGDGDGFTVPVADASGPSPIAVDCDDTNAAINPAATEVPGDGVDNDCNPTTSDVVSIVPGTIDVEAIQHMVGPGTSPSTSRGPLVGLPVNIYDQAAGSCAAGFGLTPQQFEAIWLNCAQEVVDTGHTDGNGELSLSVPPGSYLVLGQEDPDGGISGDELYVGKSANNIASGETKSIDLRLIITENGNMNPGKSSRHIGSELWIIEPEYVEWDSNQELYPFIFESVGDWTVTTTVTPPEGFVADEDSLTTEVDTSLEAAQFTITDVGSDWVDTEVEHTLAHTDKDGKVKIKKVKTKIAVKLDKALADSLGLTKWGKPKDKDKNK